MKFLSLFSGIEACSVAWKPLGWECVGFSEIEPFPCSLLAHHYPDVPNLGDITKITEQQIADLGDFDLLVFGSPCQDLSAAGTRKGFQDGTRSNLFYEALRIFDYARKHNNCRFALWENVPGAFSSNKGADFAAVVREMAGLQNVPIPPHGWGNSGVALGENGLLEWRVLDAQYFGLAQRRKRVFAILDTRNWADRPPILFEQESVRGDTPPSRTQGSEATDTTTLSVGERGKAVSEQGLTDITGTITASYGQGGADLATKPLVLDTALAFQSSYNNVAVKDNITPPILAAQGTTGNKGVYVCHGSQSPINNADELANCLGTNNGTENVVCFERRTDEVVRVAEDGVTPTLRAAMGTSGTNHVNIAYTIHADPTPKISQDVAGTLRSQGGGGIVPPNVVYGFDSKQQNASAVEELSPTLVASGYKEPVGVVSIAGNIIGRQPEHGGNQVGFNDEDISYTLTAQDRHAIVHKVNNIGDYYGYAMQADTREVLRVLWETVGTETLSEWGFGVLSQLLSQEVLQSIVHGTGVRPTPLPHSWLVHLTLSCEKTRTERTMQSLREAAGERCTPQRWKSFEQHAGKLGAYLSQLPQPGTSPTTFLYDLYEASCGAGVLRKALSTLQEIRQPSCIQTQSTQFNYIVRRLMPVETEFLMGFPRGYTDVPHNGKPASNSARYKALGNSMAVSVMRWIGEQIDHAVNYYDQVVQDEIEHQATKRIARDLVSTNKETTPMMAQSPTSLQTYLTCPKQYHAKYITKEVKFESNDHAVFGDLVHKSIENYLKHKEPLPSIMHPLQSTLDRMGQVLYGAETKLAVDAQGRAVEFFDKTAYQRCIVDAILTNADQSVVVCIDWKTGKKRDAQTQHDFIKKCTKAKFPNATVITLFIYLFKGESDRQEYTGQPLTRLDHDMNDLIKAHASGVFQPRPSGLCGKWCDVLSCPHNGRNK